MTWRSLPTLRSSMRSRATSAHGVGAVGKPQTCWTENARFVALVSHVQQFEAHRNQFFTDIYGFVVVSVRTDAENSRPGDFRDDDRQTTDNNCFTPCACARGNYVYCMIYGVIMCTCSLVSRVRPRKTIVMSERACAFRGHTPFNSRYGALIVPVFTCTSISRSFSQKWTFHLEVWMTLTFDARGVK